MTSTQLMVVEGPSKFDLMLSLFNKGQQVVFSILPSMHEDTKKIDCIISAIEKEDGSCDCWLIKGIYVGVENIAIRKSNIEITRWKKFTGFYNSRKRGGQIEIL